MSKDIRSFFQVLSKKPGDQPKPVQKLKKVAVIIDSDDEDFVKNTPEKHTTKKPVPSKRTVQALSSDSEDEGKSKKKKTLEKVHKKMEKPKLRPINLDSLNKPVKQSKVEYVPKAETSKDEEGSSHKEKEMKKKDSKESKNKKNTEKGVHGDKDFEKTLEDLDEDSDDTILLDNLDYLDKTIEDAVSAGVLDDSKFGHNVEEDQKAQNEVSICEKKDHKEAKVSHNQKLDSSKHGDENRKESDLGKDRKYHRKDRSGSKDEKKQDGDYGKDKKHEVNRSKDRSKDEKTHRTDDTKDGKHEIEHHRSKEDKKDGEKHKEKDSSRKDTPKKAEKRSRETESTPTPKKKQKLEHTDSGIDPDQEVWEKKRHSAALYQSYLHREGPKNHGMKEYPKGKPDCLSSITFLRTGVLDSLEGEEFQSLVIEHGGRVVHGVSKKVNYIVVGENPGPSKLEKARRYKIPEISEDEFLDMILVKSGMKPKYAVGNNSEDLGLGDSENGSENVSEKMDKDLSEEIEISTHDHSVVKKEIDSIPRIKKEIELSEAIKTESQVNDLSVESSSKTLTAVSVKKESSFTQGLVTVSTEQLSWTEKYKPSSMKEIIGQQDSNSNMNKLKRWLENWFMNQEPERRKKMSKPNPFKPCGSGEYYKAALLSGSPGVGKTTTATLVAKELGFDIVEFNASDTRNKKLLHEEISQMMNSKTVAGFATGEKNVNKKRVLLMDEVDGMAGNEDRGGIAELISFIKTANFPIICMCNNRDHQKMRTLVTHCFELRFGKPNVNQVRGAMLSICFKEGLKIKPDALARLITGTGCDIRQTLNHLAMWSAAEKELSSDVVQKESKNSQKDVVMGTWDVIRTVFTKSLNKDMSLSDKSRLFFYDYSLGPLFVQENYIHVTPERTSSSNVEFEEDLLRRYLTADSLSMSDVIESKIRSTNNWSLLESQAYYSTVFPSHYMSGTMTKCNFPSWFGMNSKRKKKLRIVSELYSHARIRVSGDKNSMQLDYAEPMRDLLLKPLKEQGVAGIEDTLEVMKNYSLLRDDMLNLFDLLHRFGKANLYDSINVKVKVALTKLYNKNLVLSFAPPIASKKKKSAKDGIDEELGMEEEDQSDEDETEDNVGEDALIKIKTKAPAKAGTSKNSNESKGKGKSTKKGEGKSSKGKK